MTRNPFPESQSRAMEVLGLLHSDLKEFPIYSYGKFKYYISFLDDFTPHAWIILLKKKSDAENAINQFINFLQNQFNRLPKRWHLDGGGEFTKSISTLKQKGIIVELSTPNTPQQNG